MARSTSASRLRSASAAAPYLLTESGCVWSNAVIPAAERRVEIPIEGIPGLALTLRVDLPYSTDNRRKNHPFGVATRNAAVALFVGPHAWEPGSFADTPTTTTRWDYLPVRHLTESVRELTADPAVADVLAANVERAVKEALTAVRTLAAALVAKATPAA